eukprot:gene56643-biopygen22731
MPRSVRETTETLEGAVVGFLSRDHTVRDCARAFGWGDTPAAEMRFRRWVDALGLRPGQSLSRKLPYLVCTNRLDSGVHVWLQEAARGLFGIPDLLRADEGCENRQLQALQEADGGTYIEGESKHNQPM